MDTFLNIGKRTLALITAFALGCGLMGGITFQSSPAFADTDQITGSVSELQQRIERSASDYDAAVAKVTEIEQRIQENTDRIAELEIAIPEQQEKGASATIALYKMQNESISLLSLVLESASLSEFISSLEYVERIQKASVNEVGRLKSMKQEMETTRASLESSKRQAIEEKDRAEKALTEAQAAREEAQKKALAQIAAEQAAQAQAQQAQSSNGSTPSSPSTSTPNTSTPIDWSSDKVAFVNEWSVRIDRYLAGSPLAGQGRTFAEAAWNNGVDPRWSPAISLTESSKGRNCAYSYNAWGWGSVSWSSWEEAINAHVRGLARGYGYTISIQAAQKYCSNWQHWYDVTLAQMNMI